MDCEMGTARESVLCILGSVSHGHLLVGSCDNPLPQDAARLGGVHSSVTRGGFKYRFADSLSCYCRTGSRLGFLIMQHGWAETVFGKY